MHGRLTTGSRASLLFAREHLRTPTTVVMVVVLPPLFVIASASVLTSFARALGGDVAGHAASALGAGWSVAFMAGAVGYFQTVSSRAADHRLALAGFGPLQTAAARMWSSIAICAVLVTAALLALRIEQPIAHPFHTTLAMLAYGFVYLGIGTAVGVVVRDELAGSLTVTFIFVLDVFSGPGMAPEPSPLGRLLTPSRYAGELLLRAGAGTSSPAGDWQQAAISVLVALTLAAATFWYAARRRT